MGYSEGSTDHGDYEEELFEQGAYIEEASDQGASEEPSTDEDKSLKAFLAELVETDDSPTTLDQTSQIWVYGFLGRLGAMTSGRGRYFASRSTGSYEECQKIRAQVKAESQPPRVTFGTHPHLR